jgi:hypothetical protein
MLRPSSILFAVSEQLAGRKVRHLDDPVGRGDEHAVGHAVEDTVEVVLVDGRLPQPPPHALEGLLQLRERIVRPHLDRARVVALADALGTLYQRVDRPLQPLGHVPGEGGGEERGGAGERNHQQPREARAPGALRLQPSGETHRGHGRGLLERHGDGTERLRDAVDDGAHGRRHLGAERARRWGGAALPGEEAPAGAARHGDLRQRRIVQEGLQPARHAVDVCGTKGADDRVRRVRGDALCAGLELRIQPLARGALGEQAQSARAGARARRSPPPRRAPRQGKRPPRI